MAMALAVSVGWWGCVCGGVKLGELRGRGVGVECLLAAWLQGVRSVLAQVGSGVLAQGRLPCPLPRPVRCAKWRGPHSPAGAARPVPAPLIVEHPVLCTARRGTLPPPQHSSFLLKSFSFLSRIQRGNHRTNSHTRISSPSLAQDSSAPPGPADNLQLCCRAPATQDPKHHCSHTRFSSSHSNAHWAPLLPTQSLRSFKNGNHSQRAQQKSRRQAVQRCPQSTRPRRCAR